MNISRLSLLALLLASLTLLPGCGSRSVIFAGETLPPDFSLSFQDPQTFKFQVPADGTYEWAVELTYFPEQMQGWAAVPAYYIHAAPDGKETDGKFSIPVKDGKDEWLGNVQENGHDRSTEVTFRENVELKAGAHVVKFYGDNQREGQPILGIVRFTFKVYQ